MELDKRWNELSNGEVSIHIIVPGTEAEVLQMKTELGLSYEIQPVTDLEFHQQFGLTEEQSEQMFLPLRGYGLVQDGKIVDAKEDDSVGINSVKIVEKLMD